MMDKRAALLLLLFCLSVPSTAYDPTRNLNLKWKQSVNSVGRAVAVADVDGDGYPEILVGLRNNTVLVLGADGRVKFDFSLDNVTNVGRIYALASGDLNGDGKAELIVGTGGLRVSETFKLTGFIAPNATGGNTGSIEWTRVLYKTTRYIGNLYYLDSRGGVLWKRPAYNSVLSLGVGDVDGNGVGDILVGVGDYGVDVYSEIADVNYTNQSCTTEMIVDEPTGYDIEKCKCKGCEWHFDTEECLRTYTKTTCVDVVSTVDGRVLVEYPLRNGSAIAYDRAGNVIWRKDIFKYLGKESRELDPDADNNVRVAYAADVDLDNRMEILVGSDNGILYLFNLSGKLLWTHETSGGVAAVAVASFKEPKDRYIIVGSNEGSIDILNPKGELQWRTRLKKSVEVIETADIDSDGEREIIVGSGDNNIYVYDISGINEWYYPTGSPVYSLNLLDVDGNGYMEVLLGSTNNITLYEMNIEYVLRQNAASFYAKADDYFSVSDYTMSMIYVKKAKDIYLDIKDAEGVTRCDVLIKKLNDELRTLKKLDADAQYERALAAYARNNINSSLVFLDNAKRIYTELSDAVGVTKCITLVQEIDRFLVSEKSLIAESHYARGLNYLSFKNYTAAVDEARLSRDIYHDIGYYNGTMLANRLITTIADNYYTDSKTYMSLSRFNISLDYAQRALELYNESKTYDGTAKSELLIQEINKKAAAGSAGQSAPGYSILWYVLAVLAVAALVIHLRRKKAIKDTSGGPLPEGDK